MKKTFDCEAARYMRAYLRSKVKKGDEVTTEYLFDVMMNEYRRSVPQKKAMGQFINMYLLGNCLECTEGYERKGGRTFKNILGDRYGEDFKRRIVKGHIDYLFDDEYEAICNE